MGFHFLWFSTIFHRYRMLAIVLLGHTFGWLLWLLIAHRFRRRAGSLPTIAWLLPLLLSTASLGLSPVLDDDVWRFLWDGWITTQGVNPYRTVPADFLGTRDLPAAMMSVLDRTAYPQAPTVYGPVLQFLFALCAWISPGALWPWKLCLLTALVTLIGSLRVWHPQLASQRLWLIAIAPPVLFEGALNAHPDLIGIALLSAAFAAARTHPSLSGLLMALSCGCRVQAYVMLPFLLWAWPGSARGAWLGTMGVIYLPFLLSGSPTEWQGIAAFGSVWEFNSSIVALLGSGPSARGVALLLAVAVCAAAFHQWIVEGASLHSVPGVFCYAALLCCSAVFNPWYALWMLPFLVQPGNDWRWAWLALPALSYITVGNLGLDLMNPFAHPAWLRPVEFGLLAIASYLAMKSCASAQSSASSTSRRAGSWIKGM